MRKVSQRASEIAVDFTDEAITPCGGSYFVARMAERLGLPERLSERLHVKKRDRGARDAEMVLSAVYSLAAGDGALVDVDRLGVDQARMEALGLARVPGSRRLGEYLGRFDESALDELLRVVRATVKEVAPEVIRHEVASRGYVPVFLDGTAIEVEGGYIEGARVGYSGAQQLWLHSGFVGSLWASQRLSPGAVDVTTGWREQLRDDIAPLIPADVPVWLHLDNAYYRHDVVAYCRQLGWDYSISVTSDTYKKPLRRKVAKLLGIDWQWVGDDHTEEAAIVRHRPGGWEHEQSFVVVRTHDDGAQGRLFPRLTFILTNRADLSLREVVRRHRQKQGQENAQKGPLIDLDLHHPPCLRLAANRAFYACGQLAQLLLIAVQYHLLPEAARCHGLRTLIRDLVRCAARLVRHGRQRVLRFAKTALRLHWISHAADRLDVLFAT